jgi:hypothetical protein
MTCEVFPAFAQSGYFDISELPRPFFGPIVWRDIVKIGSSSAPFLAIAATIAAAWMVSPAIAQTNASATAPFIGFRPFGTQQASAAADSSAQAAAPFNSAVGGNNTSAYPYPKSISANQGVGLGSQFSGSALQATEQASFSSRFNGSRIPTGGLNHSSQATAMAMPGNVGNNVGSLAQGAQAQGAQAQGAQAQASIAAMQNQIQYQQQILQLQATQQRQLQLIQQQRLQLASWQRQQQVARAGGQNQSRAQSVLETGLQKNATPSRPTAAAATSSTTRSTSRLNQAVVQQVGSTMKRTAETNAQPAARVANASSAVNRAATGNAPAANRVAKIPQGNCCCAPVNCCAPPQQARVFQPPANLQLPGVVQPNVGGAANLVPSLNPSAATNQGFLGQAGAGYQTQLGGYQFQPGLGTPPISQAGSGGWISNLFRGTSAYTPLLPIEPLYPNTYFGRGIIGQPTAYVGGQPMRNLMRYIFP